MFVFSAVEFQKETTLPFLGWPFAAENSHAEINWGGGWGSSNGL